MFRLVSSGMLMTTPIGTVYSAFRAGAERNINLMYRITFDANDNSEKKEKKYKNTYLHAN